jgi:serine/threonine-protein kinase RsbW
MPGRTVELRIPASSEYLVLARTAAAALGARLDFPLDRLEDLRLAVDEAVSLLLPDAVADGSVVLRMTPYDDGSGLEVEVSAATDRGRAPGPGTFAWTVLTALVDEVSASVGEDGTVRVALRAGRDVAVQA